uniref:Uncharacterized protein n=1 Tax=Cacopsylla melanoneura TaxID=428564 RepID=A0A8D9E7G2_9HEMI
MDSGKQVNNPSENLNLTKLGYERYTRTFKKPFWTYFKDPYYKTTNLEIVTVRPHSLLSTKHVSKFPAVYKSFEYNKNKRTPKFNKLPLLVGTFNFTVKTLTHTSLSLYLSLAFWLDLFSKNLITD